ncbi:MAG: hypothetical protein ACF8XB_22220 [Planctomycetota bacterium JB042]
MNRVVRALPYALALVAVVAVDADLRGPLAAPADAWIAGHPEEAGRRLLDVPPDERPGIRLPSPSDREGATPFDPAERRRLDRFLLEALRDDDARLLYSAAWWFDRGRRDDALAALRLLEERRATHAVRRLRETWEQR